MALVTCPNCGKQISEHATKCINCGYKLSENSDVQENVVNENKKKDSKSKFIILIVAIVIFVATASVILTIFIINRKNDIVEKCSYEGCENRVYSGGYCIDHYKVEMDKKRNDNPTSKDTDSSNKDEGFEEDNVETIKFSKNDKVSSENCEFTLLGYTIAKKIEPTNVTGTSIYTYFEASNSNQYIDVKFNIKNKRNSAVDQDKVLDSIKVIYDGQYEYRCSFVTVDNHNDFENHTSIYSIAPLETKEYHMLAEVPDEVKTSDKSLVVQVAADGNIYECKVR
jgi:hypothetical protein